MFEIGSWFGRVDLEIPERREFIMAWNFDSDSSGVVTAFVEECGVEDVAFA